MHPIKRAAVAVVALVALAGCGGSKAATTTTTRVTLPPAPTTTTPQAAVEVRPLSGSVGTTFQLLASRFQPAETVVFEIVFPGGKTFKGQSHKAGADGSVSATYQVTSGNPTGTYKVTATGDKGSQAVGQFDVTGASTGVSTTRVAGHVTTTTTKKP